MMSDYDRTLELQAAAYNSVGQSTVQFNKYQDTVQYKINQIKNSWERLRVSLLDQNVYKGALDKGNQLLSSIKEGFSLKDLAFIGVIGLTVGKTFITQMIKGIQADSAKMVAVAQEQSIRLSNSFKKFFNTKFNLPVSLDTTIMEKDVETTKIKIQNQLSQLSSSVRSELLTINSQPIKLEGLAQFNTMIKNLEGNAWLSEEQIISLYQKMAQSGEIQAGTQAFRNFEAQLQLIQSELLKTSGNENLTAQQAKLLKEQLAQLTTQTTELSAAQETNNQSTSRWATRFQAAGQVIGNSFGTSITAGLSTYIMTGDMQQALTTTWQTGLISLAGQIIPKVITATIPLLSPKVLIGTAIAGILLFVGTQIKKDWDEVHKPIIESLEETANEAKDRLEKITENTEIAISTAKADKESIKTIEELKKNYDELSKKISLTEEEQTKWQETISTINDQYSDTVLYYDEMNNKLVLSESLWAKMEEEARSIAETSQQIAIISQVTETQSQYNWVESTANLNKEKILSQSGVQNLQNGKLGGNTSFQKLTDAVNEDVLSGSIWRGDTYEEIEDIILNHYNNLLSVDPDFQEFDIDTFLDFIKEQYTNNSDAKNIFKDFSKNQQDILQEYLNWYSETYKEELDANEQMREDAREDYNNAMLHIVEQNLDTGSETTNRIVASQADTNSKKFEATLGLTTEEEQRSYIANGLKTLKLEDYEKQALLGVNYQQASDEEIIKYFTEQMSSIKTAEEFRAIFQEYSDSIASAFNIDLEKFPTDGINISSEENLPQLVAMGESLSKYDQAADLSASMTENLKNEFDSLYDSGLSLQERLQKINDLMNENPEWSSGIENEKENLIDTYLPGYVDVNENGQITGGLFSNIITDADMASGLAEALQNEDFSTVQMLLVKKLGNNGQLLANVLANVDEATISSISSFIADNFTGDEAQAKAQIGFQQLLEKITTGGIDLEDNELSILLNSGIDFSTNNPLSNDAITKQAAEALQNASEGALSYEEALQKVNNVYPDLIQIIGEFQYGSESAFNTLLSGSQAAADELSKQSEVVLDIIDNYDYSTGLSREQVNQLAEVGLDYLYELEDETGTLQLNMSKVTDLFAGDNEKTRNAFEKELGVERASVAILKDRLEQLKKNGASEEEIAKAQKELDSASASYNEHQKQYSQDLALRYQQTISLLQQLINKVQELQDAADEAAEKVKDSQDAYNDALKAEKEAYDNISKTAQEADESIQDAKDSANEAYESWQDAIDAIGEAEEALAEANKELYEAIHGTEDYTTGLERMYNASRRIDTIDKRLENLKETMENATNSDDIVKATEDYINMAKEKVNVLTAMNQADQQTLNNMMNDFLNNSSYDALKQFFKQTENGIEIDMQGIENADANDEIKNAAIEWAEQYNEIFDNILDRNDEISEAQKIMEDYYKTALDGYVSLQEKVADILKENAEEEISITEEKYASMKEADDAYLDALESAINKQRELREQANKYEDLATQEKKLALLSRDTSGANQKQVLELQQEVETSRTEILDAEIDNFLESMRELYETQQEARDTEIEYLNALMESTNWWTKTNELLNSFESADDYKAWLMENDTSFGDMSVEQQEQYLMEAETDYNAIPQFDAAKIMMEQWGQDLSAMIQADVNEVNRIVNELGIDTAIGEQILTAGEVARDEMIRTAEEAVAEQQQAVIDAQQTALDMEQAYYESLDAIKKAEEQKIKDVNDAQDEYLKACEDRANKQKELSNALTAQEVANEELRRAQNELTAQQALANELKAQSSSIEAMYTTAEVALGIIQDIENREVNAQKAVFEIIDGNGNNLQGGMTYGAESIDEVIQMANEMGASIRDVTNGRTYQIPSLLAYAQGGMVDYTGPAWVDGSKSKPEAFLDPEDTQNIAELTAILSSRKSSSVPFAREMISAASSFGNILYPTLNSIPTSSNISNISTTNNSTATSTNVEVHINVDSISSDYDVEQMLNVVEQRIYEVANPVGSSVILQK